MEDNYLNPCSPVGRESPSTPPWPTGATAAKHRRRIRVGRQTR